ncbi:hypothetical protein PIB30_042208 [Stylosanthes scabra]|uniref:Uncharacterized protein n=1 Tax=Stylosanthes scabra TaxID=79078 RepID=A0ABU6VEJ6_9FABA|nr:hypothetical protein [Stylosanthes scabra]
MASSSSKNSRYHQHRQPHLPDECWESIFKHLTHHPHDLESLSLVSKHFLSLTNRLLTHLTVFDPLLPLLPALLRRFPNLTSIKVPGSRYFTGDINALLSQIASFDLPSLHSLEISYQDTFPSHGLRQFSQKFPTLKSLNCSRMRPNLVLIAECFPNLEEIHVTFTSFYPETDLQVKALTSGLKKLRKVYLSGNYILQDSSIFTLCQNCVSLEELVVRGGIVTLELIGTLVSLKCLTCLHLSHSDISDEALCALADGVLPLRELSLQGCKGYQYSGISSLLRKCNNLQCLDLQGTEFLNDECVIELSLLLANLNVVKLSGKNLTDLSLFAIMRNCPLITEIRMVGTSVGKHKLEEDCLVVNSHVKFLYLASNSCLNDESVKMIALVCPNLEMIDLNHCRRVSKGAVEVLWRCCCKIQRMELALLGCELSEFQFRVNFEVPTLLVLNLSQLSITNEEISLISKSCYNLKELNLNYCYKITASGVKQVVKNCKQLRMISLYYCENVSCDIVSWMVLARPSLRKIRAPRCSSHIVDQRDYFLRHGCFVEWIPKELSLIMKWSDQIFL